MMLYTSSAVQGASGMERVEPVSRTIPAQPRSRAQDPFGPAYVREKQAAFSEEEGAALYGSDARMLRKLEQRDREVRQTESAKGEAVGDSNFIYQIGPDGKRYAVGTGPHAVATDKGADSADFANQQRPRGVDGKELSESDEELLRKLEARDAKVRNHEAAHVMAAGGQVQGLPSYTYQTGPDGQRYAIGGSVNISMMATGDEDATMRRANKAYRAAMATGEPSARDMQAARRATELAAEARQNATESYLRDDAVLPGIGRVV